nr:protein TPX2-like [Ipomoea batatas]
MGHLPSWSRMSSPMLVSPDIWSQALNSTSTVTPHGTSTPTSRGCLKPHTSSRSRRGGLAINRAVRITHRLFIRRLRLSSDQHPAPITILSIKPQTLLHKTRPGKSTSNLYTSTAKTRVEDRKVSMHFYALHFIYGH